MGDALRTTAQQKEESKLKTVPVPPISRTPTKFAVYLKAQRKKLKMSLREFAEESKIYYVRLYRMESSHSASVTIADISKIAKVLGKNTQQVINAVKRTKGA